MEIKEIETNLFDDVETLIKNIQFEPVDKDVAVIILKIHNPSFQTTEKSFNLKVMGKSMLDWIKLAFDTCPLKEIETDMKSDILSTIKPHLTNKKYTAVFYSDTPLLERRTFLNIMDWIQVKRMNVLKLERGYVFNTEFIKSCEHIYSGTEEHVFSKEDFLTVFNMSQLEIAGQILKNRIINYHQQNGVQILDKNTTFIDADVEIGKNVIIYPNNMILGESVIEDNAIIGPFCTIKQSKIGANSKISNCYLENSEVKKNTNLSPFTTILNGVKK